MTLKRGGPTGAERRTQMLKGMLDVCVLAVLAEEATYGYELVAKLQSKGLGPVAEGSIYPLLSRLEKQGLLSSYRAQSPDGPSRKYYESTIEGLEVLKVGAKEWHQFSVEVSNLLEEAK